MITVEKFVEEYNKADNKEKFVSKHIIKDKYIPYAEKIAICKRINNITLYTDVDGKKIFKKNSPEDYLFFTMELIADYTDIDVKRLDALREFDVLSSANCIDIIISNIPVNERDVMHVIKKMTVDDEMINNRDIVSFMENKSTAVRMLLETSVNEIIKQAGNNE